MSGAMPTLAWACSRGIVVRQLPRRCGQEAAEANAELDDQPDDLPAGDEGGEEQDGECAAGCEHEEAEEEAGEGHSCLSLTRQPATKPHVPA